MFQSRMIENRVASRAVKALLAPALALSVLVGQTGVAAAASYPTPVYRTTGGGTYGGQVSTGYRSLEIRLDITDEGSRQTVGVRLWAKDPGRDWTPMGGWRTATTRDVSARTGSSIYWNYGPFSQLGAGTYCLYAEYGFYRTSGWATYGLDLGCYKVTV